jgi:hypothetical protein
MTRSWHGLLVLLILVCSIASPARQGLPSSQKEQNVGAAGLEMGSDGKGARGDGIHQGIRGR